MATGSLDANGIWQYGEDDSNTTFSALLNRLGSSASTQVAADRTRLTALEANGRVLQVINNNTTTQFTTNSSAFQATTLSATITPRFSNSKIVVIVISNVLGTVANNDYVATVFRGGVGGTNLGNSNGMSQMGAAKNNQLGTFSINAYDSPGSTAAHTYNFAIKSNSSSDMYSPFGGAKAVMTLIEVKV